MTSTSTTHHTPRERAESTIRWSLLQYAAPGRSFQSGTRHEHLRTRTHLASTVRVMFGAHGAPTSGNILVPLDNTTSTKSFQRSKRRIPFHVALGRGEADPTAEGLADDMGVHVLADVDAMLHGVLETSVVKAG